jgi:hypothetical protein
MVYRRKAANARTFYYTAVYATEPRSLDEADQLRMCLEFMGSAGRETPANAPVPWFTDKVPRFPGRGWEPFRERSGAAGMLSLAAPGSHLVIQDYPVLGHSRAQVLAVCKMLKRRHWTLHVAANPGMTLDSLIEHCQQMHGTKLWRECWRWRHAVKPVQFDHPILELCVKYWELGCTSTGISRCLREFGAYEIEGVNLPADIGRYLRSHGNRAPAVVPWEEFRSDLKNLIGGIPRRPKTLSAIMREVSGMIEEQKSPAECGAIDGEEAVCRLTEVQALHVPLAVAQQFAPASDLLSPDAAEPHPPRE